MKMKGIWRRLATLTIMAALVLCLLPMGASAAYVPNENDLNPGETPNDLSSIYTSDSGNDKGVKYKVTSGNSYGVIGEVVVCGYTGNPGINGAVTIPETIEYVFGDTKFRYTVTEIEENAFDNCETAISIDYPESVTVPDGAFKGTSVTCATHRFGAESDGTCKVCDHVCSHDGGTTTSGNCNICNASLVASVHTNDKILYFTDADAALKYAEERYAKTVTILKKATVNRGIVKANLAVKQGAVLTLNPDDRFVAFEVRGSVSGGGTICTTGKPLYVESSCEECTFVVPVTVSKYGVILSGTFKRVVQNYGIVEDGTFEAGLVNYGTVKGGSVHGTLENAKGKFMGEEMTGVVYADDITQGTDFKYLDKESCCTVKNCTHINATSATCMEPQRCPFHCTGLAPINPNAHSLSYAAADNVITETCAHGCAAPATATLAINTGSVTYNGAAQTIETTITHSETWRGEKLTAQYENNINVGTAKVYIEKSGVRVEQPFTINPASIADAVVTFSPTSADYTGSDLTPTVAVRLVGFDDPLVLYTDYEIIWSPGSATTPGTYTATIKGKDNFQGTVTPAPTFIVNKATPTAANFVLIPPTSLTYDGTAKEAAVEKAAGIAETGDITNVTYYNSKGAKVETPTNADTYTVKVDVAEGDYYKAVTGLTVGSYTIEKAIPQTTIGENYSGTYDGQAHIVSVTAQQGATITYGEGVNCPYTEFPVCKDTGEYKVWYMVDMDSDNYHVINGFVELKITPKPVSVSGITAKDKVYDGTNTATLDCSNIIFGGIVNGDELGVDATGSFWQNGVGNQKVIITIHDLTGDDKDNYILDSHQTNTDASITAKPITATITVPEGNTYGNVKEPEVEFIGVVPNDTVDVTWTYKGKTNHEENNDYGPTTTMPTDAGTYTVSAAISNPNYFLTGNTTAQFNIAKAVTVKTAPVAIPNLVYDGSEQALITAGEVSDAAKTAGYEMTYMLTEGDAGYTNTVPTATDAGTYEIIWFAGYDTPNFIMSRGTFEVTIAKADIDYTAPNARTLTYNTKQQYLVSGGDSRLQYKLDNGEWSDTIPYAINAGDYTVYYRTNMGDNYNNVPETPISAKIAPFNFATADGSQIGLVENAFVYDGTAKTGNISAKVIIPNPDITPPIIEVTLTKGTDFTLTYENNVKAGTATATFTGKGNYTGVVTDTFEITKAPLTLTVEDQTITYGEEIDSTKYTVTGLVTGDTAAVTLTPSTDKITKSGSITAEITIKNAAGEDVTACYTVATSAAGLVINAKPLTETAVSGIAQTYDHTGGDLTPAIVVKDGNKTLVKGTDYDVTFTDKDGKTVEKPTDHGEYKATVVFKGNYSGSAEKTFKIVAPTYAITKGNGGKYTDGSTKNLSFTANGLFSKFTGLEVNGKTLDTKYYTAKSGSTVVTLKASYLDTLSPGKYALTFLYTDGKVSGDFTVQAKTNVPATGDSSDLLLWVALLFAGMAAMITFVFRRKRKKS